MIMTADTMNVTPHKSLGYDTSYHVHYGYHTDMRQFRPLGCRCTVFRPKEILTSKKMTNRGIPCVYVVTGISFGLKCYLAYSKTHKKVFANVEFDETFFPIRSKGKRDYGVYDEPEQHGDDVDTAQHIANNVINIINHLPVENPTWDPKDIYVTPFDRDFQNEVDRQISKQYDSNGHRSTNATATTTVRANATTVRANSTTTPAVGAADFEEATAAPPSTTVALGAADFNEPVTTSTAVIEAADYAVMFSEPGTAEPDID